MGKNGYFLYVKEMRKILPIIANISPLALN